MYANFPSLQNRYLCIIYTDITISFKFDTSIIVTYLMITDITPTIQKTKFPIFFKKKKKYDGKNIVPSKKHKKRETLENMTLGYHDKSLILNTCIIRHELTLNFTHVFSC